MTLARLTNYVDGNVLTGAQLNNEFDNILNNGAALVSAAIPSLSIVQGLTGSLISNIGSFQANGYQLKSTSTICSLTATSSYSVNTQTAGPVANGRDQAAAFASTDVHFYAITTGGTSTNAAGICSSQPPTVGPTLPAGFSAWAYLASAKYSTGSSAVPQTMRISGSRIYSQTNVVNNGGATSFTAIPISSAVPRITPAVTVQLWRYSGLATAAGGAILAEIYLASLSSGTNPSIIQTYNVSTGLPQQGHTGAAMIGQLPILESTPTLYYFIDLAIGSSCQVDVDILSYSVPNGDV